MTRTDDNRLDPTLPDGVDNENKRMTTYPTLRCISLSKIVAGTKTTTVLLLHEMHRLTKDTTTVDPSKIGLTMRASIGHNETGRIRTANRLGGCDNQRQDFDVLCDPR